MIKQTLSAVVVTGLLAVAPVTSSLAAQDAPTAPPPSGATAAAPGAPANTRTGWRIPAGAESETSPLKVDESIVAAGKKLFLNKCQRCHGSAGKGDGVDAEPRRQRSMDLTLATRAEANPDGVIFYKVWNGRVSPKMPTFSEELKRDEVWSVVAFVQSLREKPAP